MISDEWVVEVRRLIHVSKSEHASCRREQKLHAAVQIFVLHASLRRLFFRISFTIPLIDLFFTHSPLCKICILKHFLYKQIYFTHNAKVLGVRWSGLYLVAGSYLALGHCEQTSLDFTESKGNSVSFPPSRIY